VTPAICVIVPAFHGYRSVRAAIDAWRAQTCRDRLEIILLCPDAEQAATSLPEPDCAERLLDRMGEGWDAVGPAHELIILATGGLGFGAVRTERWTRLARAAFALAFPAVAAAHWLRASRRQRALKTSAFSPLALVEKGQGGLFPQPDRLLAGPMPPAACRTLLANTLPLVGRPPCPGAHPCDDDTLTRP
jgi:hypothetical protein